MVTVDDTQDEVTPNPRHSMDPLVSAMPLTTPNRRGGVEPYQAPHKGSINRPDFRGVAPPREIVPDTPPMLDTAAQLQRDQERRERQAAADRERRAAMPTQAELQARRIAALEADVSDLRVRLARLESRARGRSRSDDFPPSAA